jgi:hypothetical protein
MLNWRTTPTTEYDLIIFLAPATSERIVSKIIAIKIVLGVLFWVLILKRRNIFLRGILF